MDPDVKVAAITGAYGGLGCALSRALAERDYVLLVGGKNQAELDKLVKELEPLTKIESFLLDVRKSDQCEKFIATAEEKFGRLDVLINAAGLLTLEDVEAMKDESLKDTFETNVFGTIFCTRAAVRVMKKQGCGCIINIASRTAVDRYPSGLSLYTASKAAVIGFSGCLRKEVESMGINALVVSPYFIKNTSLYRSVNENVKTEAKQKIVTEAITDPMSVAKKILEHIENPGKEWHIILGGDIK